MVNKDTHTCMQYVHLSYRWRTWQKRCCHRISMQRSDTPSDQQTIMQTTAVLVVVSYKTNMQKVHTLYSSILFVGCQKQNIHEHAAKINQLTTDDDDDIPLHEGFYKECTANTSFHSSSCYHYYASGVNLLVICRYYCRLHLNTSFTQKMHTEVVPVVVSYLCLVVEIKSAYNRNGYLTVVDVTPILLSQIDLSPYNIIHTTCCTCRSLQHEANKYFS